MHNAASILLLLTLVLCGTASAQPAPLTVEKARQQMIEELQRLRDDVVQTGRRMTQLEDAIGKRPDRRATSKEDAEVLKLMRDHVEALSRMIDALEQMPDLFPDPKSATEVINGTRKQLVEVKGTLRRAEGAPSAFSVLREDTASTLRERASSPFSMRIASKVELASPGPAMLPITLTNRSGTPATAFLPEDGAAAIQFASIEGIAPNGYVVDCYGRVEDDPFSEGALETLAPGESRTIQVGLSRRCGLLIPGRYSLKVHWRFPARFGPGRMAKQSWVGSVGETRVELIVARPAASSQ